MTCIICNAPAVSVIKPDIDLTGIGMCKEHEKVVNLIYVVMICQGYEEAMKLLKSEQRKYKKGKDVSPSLHKHS